MFKNTNSYGVQTQSMDQYGQGSPDFRYGHDILISVKKKREKKSSKLHSSYYKDLFIKIRTRTVVTLLLLLYEFLWISL